MRWEWDVEGQIVTADMNPLTGREIVSVDGTAVINRLSWRFRSEIPLNLGEGNEAKVVAWARWGLVPACVLEIDGIRAEPRLVGGIHQLPWWGKLCLAALGVWLVIGLVFFIVLPGVHRIRGGTTLPAARWSEADLVSLPPDDANAWYLVGSSQSIPNFNLDRELLGRERIPASDIALTDAALRQPGVAHTLHQAASVRAWPQLAPPSRIDPYETTDVFRLPAWHDWVLLSLKRKVDREPAAAAADLAALIPMWIRCANLARDALDYSVCAVQARRDLELLLELADTLHDRGARTRLADAIRDGPPLSSRNMLIAEYIAAYRGLDSYRVNGKRTFLAWTDLKRTLADIDQAFAMLAAGKSCQEIEPQLWHYNWGGEAFAMLLTSSACVAGPYVVEVTEEVAELRDRALFVLDESPN